MGTVALALNIASNNDVEYKVKHISAHCQSFYTGDVVALFRSKLTVIASLNRTKSDAVAVTMALS